MARTKETILKQHEDASMEDKKSVPHSATLLVHDALRLEVAIDTRDELRRIADILSNNSSEGEFQVRSHQSA